MRLAGNAVAENQAFRIGRAVYGIQFHFEADRPLVRALERILRIAHCRAPSGLERRLDDEWPATEPDADAAGLAIARAWVATI